MAFKVTGAKRTQAYMGRYQLVDRLTAQVGGDRDKAIRILKNRGDMYPDGTLTPKGKQRNAMTAEERAIDRFLKEKNNPNLGPHDCIYNRATNKVKLKNQY